MRNKTRLTYTERWAVQASDWHFNALAGAVGGFTSGIVTCPLDVIKTKLQAQGGFTAGQQGGHLVRTKAYEGLVGTASVIWKEEGIRGMYRGLGPIIMGYLPTWAVWFSVYNQSKQYLGQYHCQLQHDYAGEVSKADSINSKYICSELLVVDNSWRQQHHRHQPDMGYQNPTHVAVRPP